MSLVVIGFIAVVGTILYMRSKRKTSKKGKSSGSSGSTGKGDLRNPK